MANTIICTCGNPLELDFDSVAIIFY